jgi:capsular exopolysaccharide synthesis family protein
MNDESNRSATGSEARGYSGNNYPSQDGMGAVGYGDSPVQRTMRDYLMILRERIWYVVAVFLAVFLASLVYTLSTTKLYTAAASIEILRHDPVVMKVQEVRDSELRGPEDLNTFVKFLESATLVQKVAERLTVEERKALMAPYENSRSGDPMLPEEVLGLNRRVAPIRQTRILQVAYTHADGEIAAKMANYFVEEFMAYNSRWRNDESLKAVDDLKVRADQQRKKVQELANNLQTYKERNNMVSLDQRKDIVTEKLKTVSVLLTQATSHLADTELRWNQVKEYQAAKNNLADLNFVASTPIIQNLLQQVATQKIGVAQLQQRYRALHPKMQEATRSLVQTEAELTRAIDSAAVSIRNEYESALRAVEHAKIDLTTQEAEALKVDRFSVEYQSQQNELTVNEQLLANIISRMRETSMNASIESQNARSVDRASRPNPKQYSTPNIPLNLGLGAVGGLGLGLAIAFFVAFLDDRVKSAYDVESVVGLPLIGIIPQIRKMEATEKSQIVLTNADPLAAEAFLTLHSNLRLNGQGGKSQVILVTSTTPSEGKSFVASNLALTFAAHGERTLIVDCDLRKPNVYRSFGVSNNKGVIDYCSAEAPLENLIIKNHRPNLDILTTGGRATTPTHVLNHERFGAMMMDLRKRYDRIVVDTPPLAPVSDAMIVLPHVDGVLFTLLFNHVRKKGAVFCVNRLLDSKVTCYGAVLNGLNLALSEYYYAEYYDKSYRDYHLAPTALSANKA